MSTVLHTEVDNMANKKTNTKGKTLAMAQIAICAALLCVLSPLSVPTPLNIAFTLQVFIVILTALVLKPFYALAAQLLYTLLGVIGLPVFSGWQSGFGVLAGPTGGFLVGFILASFFVSLAKGKTNGKYAVLRYLIAAVAVGIPCIYLPGILGFMLYAGVDFSKAFMLVAATFIPIDLAKCVIAALVAVPIHKALSLTV